MISSVQIAKQARLETCQASRDGSHVDLLQPTNRANVIEATLLLDEPRTGWTDLLVRALHRRNSGCRNPSLGWRDQ